MRNIRVNRCINPRMSR